MTYSSEYYRNNRNEILAQKKRKRERRDVHCKFCNSIRLWKAGKVLRSGNRLQRWICRRCGRYTTTPIYSCKLSIKKELIKI